MNIFSLPARFVLFLSTRNRSVFLAAVIGLVIGSIVQANAGQEQPYSTKTPVVRQYSMDDRIKYQLWDYTWKPDPDEPITRIEVRLSEQRVYVYQGSRLAGSSPTTTGKPGHETPPGHYTILVKDIDHKSNLYGVFLDKNGYIVDGNASASQTPPQGAVYDSADMPYYLRIREDGVGLHAGFLPGHPDSHGCIRLPNAFAELLFSNVSAGTPVDVVP